MNGIIDIKVPILGEKRLVMNYFASMEFEKAVFRNANDNTAKMFTDLVYSGLYGDSMISANQMPTYQEAVLLVAEMAEQDDFDEVSMKIWNTYNESKWGADFQKRIAAFNEENKKKAEETEEVKPKKKSVQK